MTPPKEFSYVPVEGIEKSSNRWWFNNDFSKEVLGMKSTITQEQLAKVIKSHDEHWTGSGFDYHNSVAAAILEFLNKGGER